MERIVEVANIATYLVVGLFVVGAVKCITGDIAYGQLVDDFKFILPGLAVGRGLASQGRILGKNS